MNAVAMPKWAVISGLLPERLNVAFYFCRNNLICIFLPNPFFYHQRFESVAFFLFSFLSKEVDSILKQKFLETF